MIDQFEQALAFTIGPDEAPAGEEGGYSDDPSDTGGITMRGITIAEYQRWTRRPVSAAEMRALTRADVIPIYSGNYWNAARCWALAPGVDLMVFDHGVNRGVGATARALQQAVQAKPDGIIGPMTALAARGIPAATLIAKLHDLQMAQYQSLAQWPRYGKDWGGRCDRRRDAALALTT